MQTSTLSPATVAPAASPKKSVISSDFDTFLKMMTTQIKNQDPTNPMDSAEFAVQLATFSGVEQQVRTNDLLGALSGQFGVMGMSQLAAWVGQEARAPSPVYLGDAEVSLSYSSTVGADRAVLSVRDANGTVVGREDVPLGTGPYQWKGLDLKGEALPNGTYALSLESYKGDEKLGDATNVEAYARIVEARSGPNGTLLVLEGGIEVAATAVTALRMAATQAAIAPTQNGQVPSQYSATGRQLGSHMPSDHGQGDIFSMKSEEIDVSEEIFSENPIATLDQNGQPIPETYTPD